MELTRNGVGKDLEKTEAEGGDCWCNVVAAAAVNPIERRAEGKRRKVEENSLVVVLGREGGEGIISFFGGAVGTRIR